jgi:hypothetical protein
MLPLMLCVSSVSVAEAQQKPRVTHYADTFFREPPDSLKEMIATADAVVRVRVTGQTPRDIQIGESARTRPATTVRAIVVNAIHVQGGHGAIPNDISMVVAGGERDRGSYIEETRQSRFPALEAGHEYVWFLAWNVALDDWVPAFGPDSIWEITRKRVESAGTAKITLQFKERSAVDALEQLRIAAKP